MKKVYIDTETTGFKPGQITQISYIIEEDSGISKVVNQYFKVDSIEQGASNVTGLTTNILEQLSGGKIFVDRSDEILTDLKDAIFIAQNSVFDIRFIEAEFERLGINFRPDKTFCTMKYMKNIIKLPGNRGYKNPSLQDILNYSGIGQADVLRFASAAFRNSCLGAHDARFDSMAVYLICKKLEKFGVFNIEETVKLQSSISDINI